MQEKPPQWFLKLAPAVQRKVLTTVNGSGTKIDYPHTCLGVGIHASFEHMTEIFDLFPWSVSSKIVEEAFDHFFSYMYYTVPAVANRSLQTSQNAATVWMVMMEAHVAGIPRQSPAAEAMLLNSAYI